MKFQDSSFNGLKVTVGTKSVTHPRRHAPKAICPINFFKVGGIIIVVNIEMSSSPLYCCRSNPTNSIRLLCFRSLLARDVFWLIKN